MNKIKRQSKRIISIVLAIIILISIMPNFGLLKISNATDFESGVILRLDTEKGIWTDDDGEYWAISLDILVKDMELTSFALPIKFDTSKLTPAYHYIGKKDEYIDYANDVDEFTDNMNEKLLPDTFSANDKSSDTDWSNVKNGKIVLEFLDSNGETHDFEGENLICTISFIVDDSITDISQINADLINIDKDNQLFEIFNFENREYYTDTNTYFSLQNISTQPTISLLKITQNPTAGKVYEHGDEINLFGGILEATYTDGSIKRIFMDNVNVTTGTKKGAYADINNPMTLEYKGKTLELEVNVIDPVEQIKFYDKNDVLKDYSFNEGDTIPVDKLYIKTITKSGEEKEIRLDNEKIQLDYVNVEENEKEIKEIQITYTDENVTKTTSFNILVNDAVGEIKISSTNVPESNLIINDDFEKTGAIEVISRDGHSYGEIEIASDNVIVTEEDGSEIDLSKVVEEKVLKVSYMGVSTTYKVNVQNTVVSVEVSDGVKTKYNENITADDFTGVTVTEIMADGTNGDTKAIDFSWVDTSTYDNKSLSKQNLKINYPYGEKTIEGTVEVKVKNELLEIRIENLQTNYVYLDELNYEGAELYIKYASGETGPYEMDDITLTNNFDNKKIGDQEVTFTYDDEVDSISTTVSINVERAILSKPDCNTLEILEDVALSTIESELPTTTYGSVVWENPAQTLSIKNGETQKINAVYKMNETWKEFYQDVPMEVNVKVKTEKISSISLKTEPKLEYYEGQTLDVSALELNVIYEDGTTGVISGGYTIEGIELDKPLTREDNGKKITIKYKDFEPRELNITVNKDEVIGIVLNTENAKKEYKYNEELDLSNITVKKVMASGIEQEEVVVKDNEEVTVSNNYDKTNITDLQTIEVTYAGYTKSYTVQVKDYVAKIELTDETKGKLKTQYNYGNTIKVTGKDTNEKLYINVYMASDMQNPVQEELTQDMITADTSKLGIQEVVVKYEEASTTFEITVLDYVSAIEIVHQPTKRIYNIGEELDVTGLIIRDVMASEATIEAKDTTLTEEQYELSTFDSSVEGTKIIKVTRKDIDIEPIGFTVLVLGENLEVSINSLPTAETYYGKELDLTGGSIIVKTSKDDIGTIISMTDELIEVEGYNPTQIGIQTVRLKYAYGEEELEVDLDITVLDYTVDEIKITSNPTKLTYKFGESLNLVGGEVAKLKASGTEFAKNPLTNDMITGFDPQKIGTQIITVKYGNSTATFKVTVVDNIYGITMNSNPDKVTYKYGEELNIAGATIKVQKDSGIEIVAVTADMISGYDKTKSGEQLITVSYEGFKTQFTVKTEKLISAIDKENDSNQGIINKAEYIVTFKDYDGTILKIIYVKQGEEATPPTVNKRDGYIFTGWDKDYSNIQKDMIIYAQYEEEKSQEQTSPKPSQTLGEKDKDKDNEQESLLPALVGLIITGTLLLLITNLTKKNVEICIITDERKLIGKQRISKKERTIYLDEYKDEINIAKAELVISAKIAEQLNGEEITVVLNRKETSYKIVANNDEDVVISIIK